MPGGAWDATVRGPAGLGMGQGGVYSPSAVLFFPVFNDQGTGTETTVVLTNTHTSTVYARWFFINKNPATPITNAILELAAGSVTTLLASTLALNQPGSLIIIATDINGAPVATNKFTATCNYVASGIDVTYLPVACRAIGSAPTLMTNNGGNYELNFDGVGYEMLPKMFHAEVSSTSTRLFLATIPPSFLAGLGVALLNVALINKSTRKQIVATFSVATYANQSAIIIPISSIFGSVLTTDITTGGIWDVFVWSKQPGIHAFFQSAAGNSVITNEVVHGRLPGTYDIFTVLNYPLGA